MANVQNNTICIMITLNICWGPYTKCIITDNVLKIDNGLKNNFIEIIENTYGVSPTQTF